MSSKVPPRLARVGLMRIETNLKQGQCLALPKGLILTFFKDEIFKGLEERKTAQEPAPEPPKRRYLKTPGEAE